MCIKDLDGTSDFSFIMFSILSLKFYIILTLFNNPLNDIHLFIQQPFIEWQALFRRHTTDIGVCTSDEDKQWKQEHIKGQLPKSNNLPCGKIESEMA